MKTKFLLTTALVFAGVSIFGVITAFQPKKPWIAPGNYINMKNAVPSNAESIANGKSLWGTHCKSCHGNKGLGDGSKAAQLKTDPGNFSLAEEQKEPDGSFFYKISEGRDDMPSFKKKIPDQDDIWGLVNYIRTMKK